MRGRPTKFRPTFVKKVNNCYEKCLKDNIMPFIEDLVLLLGVSDDSIIRYCEANKDFCGAVDRIKLLQRRSLKQIVARTPQGAIFLLKANHGLVETEKVLHGGTQEVEPICLVVSRAPEPH